MPYLVRVRPARNVLTRSKITHAANRQLITIIYAGPRILPTEQFYRDASITLLNAGCFRFFTLIQCFDRPA